MSKKKCGNCDLWRTHGCQYYGSYMGRERAYDSPFCSAYIPKMNLQPRCGDCRHLNGALCTHPAENLPTRKQTCMACCLFEPNNQQ